MDAVQIANSPRISNLTSEIFFMRNQNAYFKAIGSQLGMRITNRVIIRLEALLAQRKEELSNVDATN